MRRRFQHAQIGRCWGSSIILPTCYDRSKTHIRVIYEKTVEEPKGWIDIPIRNDFGNPIHTWMIQIVIKQNHQSGRDSHLRQGFGHHQTFWDF